MVSRCALLLETFAQEQLPKQLTSILATKMHLHTSAKNSAFWFDASSAELSSAVAAPGALPNDDPAVGSYDDYISATGGVPLRPFMARGKGGSEYAFLIKHSVPASTLYPTTKASGLPGTFYPSRHDTSLHLRSSLQGLLGGCHDCARFCGSAGAMTDADGPVVLGPAARRELVALKGRGVRFLRAPGAPGAWSGAGCGTA